MTHNLLRQPPQLLNTNPIAAYDRNEDCQVFAHGWLHMDVQLCDQCVINSLWTKMCGIISTIFRGENSLNQIENFTPFFKKNKSYVTILLFTVRSCCHMLMVYIRAKDTIKIKKNTI